MTREDLIRSSKQLAQDAGVSGVALLLDPASYEEAIDMAHALYAVDTLGTLVVSYTVPAVGYRFPLTGVGAVTPGWVVGASVLREVYLPFSSTTPSDPVDVNAYRIVTDPGGVVVLEFLDRQANAGDVLRLVFTAPQIIGVTPAETTVPESRWRAFRVLCGAMVLQLAANKAAQNSANSGFPTDIVDRRTQSDILQARSTKMLNFYYTLIGKVVPTGGGGGSTDPMSGAPLSSFKDTDVEMSSGLGALWHFSSRR